MRIRINDLRFIRRSFQLIELFIQTILWPKFYFVVFNGMYTWCILHRHIYHAVMYIDHEMN
jgi:hypothetical protein